MVGSSLDRRSSAANPRGSTEEAVPANAQFKGEATTPGFLLALGKPFEKSQCQDRQYLELRSCLSYFTAAPPWRGRKSRPLRRMSLSKRLSAAS